MELPNANSPPCVVYGKGSLTFVSSLQNSTFALTATPVLSGQYVLWTSAITNIFESLMNIMGTQP